MEVVSVTDARLLAWLNAHLHTLHVQECPGLFKPYNENEVTAYFEQCLLTPGYYHYGVMRGGSLAGFVQAQLMERPETAFAYPYTYLHIHQLSVHPRYRRQGIAKALVGKVREIALGNSTSRIDLTVWDFNRGALDFYKAQGFAPDLLRLYTTV